MASRCEDGTVTSDFLDELPNFHTDTFSSLKNIQEDLPKSRKVMSKIQEKCKYHCLYHCLYFSYTTSYPSFITFL